ncbi:MAG: SurA N-terminal domain-containing protein [Flavobacteriaceae bacterium]|jgi:peptidyl-prolyl cis-trans isomerase D|nr:SurA N-terminal domain-containing protein [Flavobacteriaceae bacterium]
MAVLGEIRKRPKLLIVVIAVALLAFLVDGDTLDRFFGKNPGVFGKVNREKITREEFNDQLLMLQQQAEQQGQPSTGLEEQAWNILVRSKLIKQQFENLGLKMNDDFFWSQVQFDPAFSQNPANFDEKGNFKLQEIKKQVEDLQNSGDVNTYANWLRTRRNMEYGMMARQVFGSIAAGITANKKEAEEMIKQRDQMANIDFVKIDYAAFEKKNPVKVTTQDLADYINKHPLNFKTDASRNLGIVYFPAKASAADEAETEQELNKLLTEGTDIGGGQETFANTANDSLFVTANSDMPFNSQYFSANQLPAGVKDKIPTANIGQVFGPYKEQNFYIVTKLVDKKPSDSTLSSHILIAYQGAERSTATRTKEQAKKIADSLLATIKTEPAKFMDGLKLSDEPNAVERAGSVGWTTPQSQFAQGYLNFLSSNAKGSVGMAETQFGYHIIKVDDKKSGTMSYKLANLIKSIKTSEKTENDVATAATRFIQQIEKKSFNDFSNVAKKSNYPFSNPKTVMRFQGKLPQVGTDKDNDVIVWAFDKKRKKGDTEIFTVEGTGEKIVVFLNGIQEAGTADPESVREQIEPIVKNQLLAKKISEKISSAKATSLDQIAKLFAATKESGQINLLNPQIAGAMEPKVAGAAFGVANNKISNPVEGMAGVYVVQRKSIDTNKQPGDVKSIMETMTQQNSQMFGQYFMKSLQDNADIEDFRIEVYNKGQQ